MAISVDGVDGGTNTNTNSTSLKPQQPHNFSLVRLFMKQKSISAEGMSCGMDQSSASECWPASQSEDSGDSFDLKARGCHNRMTRSTEKCPMFVDSLVDGGAANSDSTHMQRTHDLIREEVEDVSERSESVEQLSESASRADSIYNSYEHDRQCCQQKFTKFTKFNVNNNNSSVEHDDELANVHHKRRFRRGTQTRCSNTSNESVDASSSTESTDCTRIHAKPTTIVVSTKHSATQYPVHLMNKSMQTSRYTPHMNRLFIFIIFIILKSVFNHVSAPVDLLTAMSGSE